MFDSLLGNISNVAPLSQFKIYLATGIAFLALVIALGVQTLRLNAEQAAHRATRAELSGKLALEQTANQLLRLSLDNAKAGLASLHDQLRAAQARAAEREAAAAERAAIAAASTTVPPVELREQVLDLPGSALVVDYLNKRLRQFNGAPHGR